jgi:acyl carrier protein
MFQRESSRGVTHVLTGNNMIRERIRAFIVDQFLFGAAGRLSDETPLLEQHVVDSTGILEIVAFIEDTYGIRVMDTELVPENLNTVANISRFVETKREGAR